MVRHTAGRIYLIALLLSIIGFIVFLVMGGTNATESTGYDRTSLSVYPRVDYPGLLHEMLGKLAALGVNLSKIESRPSKGRLGDYVFYMDVQGHIRDGRVAEGVRELEKMAFVRVLGSYSRQY